VGLKFLQSGGDDFREVAFLVSLGDPNGLIKLAFAEGAGDCGGELAGLLAGGAVSNPTVDHHANGPCRHDEEDDNDGAGEPSHLTPEGERVPSDAAVIAFLKEPKSYEVSFCQEKSC